MEEVFVYGTLMLGLSNFKRYLKGRVNSVRDARTRGELYYLPQGYPGLLPGRDWVKGQIMELRYGTILQELDELEGYYGEGETNLYDRVKRPVILPGKQIIECWTYLYRDTDYARRFGVYIPDGDWQLFRKP